MNNSRSVKNRLGKVVGIVLILDLVLVVTVKLGLGLGEQLLWFCHVSLAISAIAVLSRSPLLLAVALANVLVLHSCWIVDFLCWKVTGEFPLGLSSYAASTSGWTWLATAHHLFLLPAMIACFLQVRVYPRSTWLIAATIFVWVTLLSRAVTSPGNNVNYAFFIPASLDWTGVCRLNSLPDEYYLLGLNLVVNLFLFLPASLLLSAISKRPGQVATQLNSKAAGTASQTAGCL